MYRRAAAGWPRHRREAGEPARSAAGNYRSWARYRPDEVDTRADDLGLFDANADDDLLTTERVVALAREANAVYILEHFGVDPDAVEAPSADAPEARRQHPFERLDEPIERLSAGCRCALAGTAPRTRPGRGPGRGRVRASGSRTPRGVSGRTGALRPRPQRHRRPRRPPGPRRRTGSRRPRRAGRARRAESTTETAPALSIAAGSPGAAASPPGPVREVRQPPLPTLLVGRHHGSARRPASPPARNPLPRPGSRLQTAARVCLYSSPVTGKNSVTRRSSPALESPGVRSSSFLNTIVRITHRPDKFLSSLVDARSTRRRPRASRTRRSPTRSREGGGATVVVRHLDAGSAGRQKRPTPPKACAPTRTKRPASRRPRAHARSPRACSRTAGAVHEQVVGNGRGPPGGPQHSALCGVFGGVVTGEQP